MSVIDPTGELVSRIRELTSARPSPSIADVAGNPDTPGPDTPAASEFTQKYELEALVNAVRSNADQSLALLQMVDDARRG